MIKDITIGQYFPGSSPIHKMDPRMKLILTIVYIVLLFLVENFYGLLLIAAFFSFIVFLSKISVKTILKSLKPLIFIIVFTAFFNIFYAKGEPLIQDVPLLAWLTLNGIVYAFFMAVRITLLVSGSSILTYTTSPVMLTDALERLMSPLKYIKVPVHDFAMMMTIALRFIPTLIDETEKIMNAQKARGADFETGNIMRRAKALIPILIPLIISAFRRAEDLAFAMECRCYNSGSHRTRYKTYSFCARDYIAALIFVILIVLIFWINAYL